MKTKTNNSLVSFAYALAHPALLFYALPWLMFLLVGGTVAQRYIGLYQSEKLFFGSFVFWLGPVPLPGAYTTLGVIALCMVAKLLLKSPPNRAKLGVIVTHVSVLVLLAGGLISTLCREEGYMVLGADETGSVVSDYHNRELAVLMNGKPVAVLPQKALHEGAEIRSPSLPFSLRIVQFCANCTARQREHPAATMRGVAEKIDIVSAPLRREDAENESGATVTVSGLSAQQDGTYVTSEALAQPAAFTRGKDRYEIVMQHQQRDIPFAVRLKRFVKTDYPGTAMARSYSSEVAVKDGTVEWNAVIEMNQPLRHAGYTLYQSSFVENQGRLYTVLAVVKNTGALFPYIAIATLCAGLLLHLGILFLPKGKA